MGGDDEKTLKKKAGQVLQDVGRLIVKALGTTISISFQYAFYEVLSAFGLKERIYERLIYAALTLLLGPIIWFSLAKVIASMNLALHENDKEAPNLFLLDAVVLTAACVHTNKSWAFKSLITTEFGDIFGSSEGKYGAEAAILLLVSYGVFLLRNAIFGEAKENIKKPPPGGFTLVQAYSIGFYAAFPNVTGYYINLTLSTWWENLLAAVRLKKFIAQDTWVLIMTKVVLFLLVSTAVKLIMLFSSGRQKTAPTQADGGIQHVKRLKLEQNTAEKSLLRTYAWSLAYALNLFIFDDIGQCEYQPHGEGLPSYPRYCPVPMNFVYAASITVVFGFITVMNAMAEERTWWSYYERKAQHGAFPMICGWAWAGYVYSRMNILTLTFSSENENGRWIVPVLHVITWLFLVCIGSYLYNLYMAFTRDVHVEGFCIEADQEATGRDARSASRAETVDSSSQGLLPK
eukprot:TRINITY_DN65720_c0_g1_i1.p1 TRINITY_DN65720_c0_g1~~TRINITY_DN65720_c0_g1_i1.p1  ORF type:complete len:481 (+),score=80.78 TRINITY_DN65720_c0_g1_i1:66-1445(+)